MERPSREEDVSDRPRTPHWRKPSFWKTFATFLVVYLILRILVTLAIDWSGAPAGPEPGTGPEGASPIPVPNDSTGQAAPFG